MTNIELRYAGEVMVAASRGLKIEFRYKPEIQNTDWEICTNPIWDWLHCDYRIAIPEKKKKIIKVAPAVYKLIGNNKFAISSSMSESVEQAKKLHGEYFVLWPATPLIEIEVEE